MLKSDMRAYLFLLSYFCADSVLLFLNVSFRILNSIHVS